MLVICVVRVCACVRVLALHISVKCHHHSHLHYAVIIRSVFVLFLWTQSHLPCFRHRSVEEEQGCLFFMRMSTRDSLWICISVQSVRARSRSLWISTRKKRQRGGRRARHDVTSPVPPPPPLPALPSPQHPPHLLQFEWKDYSKRRMTFNLKIVLVFPPPFFLELPPKPLLSLLPLSSVDMDL